MPLALGLSKEYFDGMLRISIDNSTTMDDAEEFVKEFASCYNYLESVMSGN